jgi:hypothetical protein
MRCVIGADDTHDRDRLKGNCFRYRMWRPGAVMRQDTQHGAYYVHGELPPMTLLTKLVVTAGALTLVVAAPFVALLMTYSTANPCHALAQEMLRYGVGADLSAPGVLGMRLAAEALARPMTPTQCGQALADYYFGGAELRDAVMTARPEAVHRMPPRMPTN